MTAIKNYLNKEVSLAPLAFFRICFGILLFVSMVRFWLNGWIESLYIKPGFHFTFYGFEFVKDWGVYTYVLFLICAVSALMVAIGYRFRIFSTLLFLSFTYIELIDKTYYLNHYYFISLLSFLLIFTPAHKAYSADAYLKKSISTSSVPRMYIDAFKLMLGILYFYAGLAKVNSDWLVNAMPLKIWLPAKNDLPLIGFLFNYEASAYIFSWAGCLFDLSIPFLLLNNKTRPFAYIFVVVFHFLTSMLFPIGMFPAIMTVSALVFFSPSFHQKILDFVFSKLPNWAPVTRIAYKAKNQALVFSLFASFFIIQTIFPFRYLAYPGELFWTEEGYRFSWRVMLMEKAGYAQFKIIDSEGRAQTVDNTEYLTPQQEKMMSTQADMLLQYAHFLKTQYESQGKKDISIYADTYVSLNGRLSQPYIDPKIDLCKVSESFKPKYWILPFQDEIKGF